MIARIGLAALAVAALLACRAPSETPAAAPPSGAPPAGSHGLPPGAEAAAPVAKLRVPYSAVSGSTLLLPLAHEAGLFARYGLDVEVVSIPGSSVVVQSMIAAEIPISAVSSAAVVDANLAGADIPIIAGVVNHPVNVLMVVPGVNAVSDLRGRRLGVPRIGDSTDFLTRYALRQQGLEPDRDTAIVQIGGNQEIVTAMQNGAIDGGALSSPSTIQARRLGYHQILDLGTLGIPYQHTTVNVLGSYLKTHEDVTQRFLKAYIEAIWLFRADKAFTQKALADFVHTDDQEVLDETWDLYANQYLERVPYPTLEGLQTVLNESLQPKAKEAKPDQFVDLHLLDGLKASGFFDDLRARYGD
jgi:NitT/TauT family transport system substrate-binding protein